MFHGERMRILVLLTLVLSPVSVQADILHLRGGVCHHGTLIQQTETEVIFRIERDGGSVIDRFPLKYVERIELEASPPPVAKNEPAAQQPAEIDTPPDYEQMLREAYELIDDQDLPAALRALQRIVRNAPGDMLETLDAQAQTHRGATLAALLARTRMQVALCNDGPPLFDLKTPTRYEAGALGEQLETFYSHILATRYDGRSLSDWMADPAAYDTLRVDARRLATDARLAAAALGARVRWDPALKDDTRTRQSLVALRAELTELIAHVQELPGFTSLGRDEFDEDDPTLIAVERLAREQAAAATQPAAASENEPEP